MKTLRMNLEKSSYDIKIKEGLLSDINEEIKEVYSHKKVYIITDSNVGPLYLDKVTSALIDFDVKSIVIPSGEESKSIEVYLKVVEELISLGLKRNELLIALGGGVIGDLTGFVAATIYRGIPYLSIPTSLLSQMDSSIGGKTGIDFNGLKNIIGSFKQPLKVLIDPNTLKTLPREEFENGMGELIKHGCIGNKELLDRLEDNAHIDEEVIYQSLLVKKTFVEMDPFDQKERMYLNFGHTFGHAIELKYGYKHGQAVAIGMLMAIEMGIDLGITDKECLPKLKSILEKYGLPTAKYDYKEYSNAIMYDKKNLAGVLRIIFIKNFGEVFMKEFKESDLN